MGPSIVVNLQDRRHTLEGGEGLAGHVHGFCMVSRSKGLRTMGAHSQEGNVAEAGHNEGRERTLVEWILRGTL